MRQTLSAGKVQTVLGVVDSDALGVTMVHEHLLHDSSVFFTEPAAAGDRPLAHQPVCLENLSWVRRNEIHSLDNIRLTDEALAIKEATLYQLARGDTMVELTTHGVFGRDPLGLVRISRATGLNIIMGTGYDVAALHTPTLIAQTDEEVTDELVNEIVAGVEHTGVRAGIIGEIGCSTLNETERKVLRCCARAQQRTGVAISIHPTPNDAAALEILTILTDAGADPGHIIMGHVDISGFSRATCHQLADAGCYLGYDSFGMEGLMELPGLGRTVDLRDTKRIDDIVALIADGYAERVVVSQDIPTKHRLVAYGGFGYAHILTDIVPTMLRKGVTEDQLDTILVENPKRVLTCWLPQTNEDEGPIT
jgi:phosphotriesterase-related protein